MLSSYKKNGLTVNILEWVSFKNEQNNIDSYLKAEVIYQNENRIDIIKGEELNFLLKTADVKGLKKANFNVQNNKPFKEYAEIYYDMIV